MSSSNGGGGGTSDFFVLERFRDGRASDGGHEEDGRHEAPVALVVDTIESGVNAQLLDEFRDGEHHCRSGGGCGGTRTRSGDGDGWSRSGDWDEIEELVGGEVDAADELGERLIDTLDHAEEFLDRVETRDWGAFAVGDLDSLPESSWVPACGVVVVTLHGVREPLEDFASSLHGLVLPGIDLLVSGVDLVLSDCRRTGADGEGSRTFALAVDDAPVALGHEGSFHARRPFVVVGVVEHDEVAADLPSHGDRGNRLVSD